MDDKKQLNFKVPEWVHRQAKAIAAQTGRPLQDVLAEVISDWVKQEQSKQQLPAR